MDEFTEKRLEKRIAILEHDLDEALTLINQVQQALLETDLTVGITNKATGKLVDSLLTFYRNYQVPTVKWLTF